MLTWLARRQLDAFESDWSYDVAYMREILDDAGVEAVAALGGIQKISGYRRDLPADVYFAAKLVAVRSGDCGPCLQLVTKMAERSGVDTTTIRQVLTGDRDAMSEPVRLAYDLARSVIARDGWDAPPRNELRKRYGGRAVVSLAYAIASGRFFPDLKYALGAGHACSRVRVGETDVVPQPV